MRYLLVMYQNNVKISHNKVYVEKLFKFLEIEEDYEFYVSNQKDYEFLDCFGNDSGKTIEFGFL